VELEVRELALQVLEEKVVTEELVVMVLMEVLVVQVSLFL
jgi:hypothetical protein